MRKRADRNHKETKFTIEALKKGRPTSYFRSDRIELSDIEVLFVPDDSQMYSFGH